MPIRLTAETSTISTIGQYHSPENIRSDSCSDGWFQTLGQRAIADQMCHRPAQANHQQTEDDRGDQPGEHGDAAGDIAAQLPGDLRAGQGIAEGGEKADQEQRARAVIHG